MASRKSGLKNTMPSDLMIPWMACHLINVWLKEAKSVHFQLVLNMGC